ncbi:hypothetical protein ABZV93_25815 [Actinopolymorpha sp. NPDC004070]|uniref:HAD family hydrolase n=1 Tax=Actinopolymorpha sp. NPDC004070 TaxID=3154548 RepID=UPI0033AF7162
MAVIYFDGDQTLWDFRALMRRTLAATIEELRRLVPAAEGDLSIDTFVADREFVAEHLAGTVTNLESIRLAAFTHSLRRLGIVDAGLAEHLNDYYLQRRFADVDLYDDVLPTLETLVRDHSVGLLSNGTSWWVTRSATTSRTSSARHLSHFTRRELEQELSMKVQVPEVKAADVRSRIR